MSTIFLFLVQLLEPQLILHDHKPNVTCSVDLLDSGWWVSTAVTVGLCSPANSSRAVPDVVLLPGTRHVMRCGKWCCRLVSA